MVPPPRKTPEDYLHDNLALATKLAALVATVNGCYPYPNEQPKYLVTLERAFSKVANQINQQVEQLFGDEAAQ